MRSGGALISSPGDGSTISIAGVPYRILPANYSVVDTPNFVPPSRQGNPGFADTAPENIVAWKDWSRGFGTYYWDAQHPDNYSDSNGIDASIQQQLTLALVVGTTALSGGMALNDRARFIEFNGEEYAVGSSSVYYWQPAASPNGWVVARAGVSPNAGQATVFAVNPAASTAAVPGGNYLIVGAGGNQFFIQNASTSFVVATQAVHFCAIGNTMWKAYIQYSASPTQAQWKIAKTADGLTYASPLDVAINGLGSPTVNALRAYDNRLYMFTTQGFSTIDASANIIDLIPEINDYGDPQVGQANAVFHGQLWVNSNYGLLRFDGSNVLNPQTEQSLRSLGPDQQSHSISPARGKFYDLGAHTNFLYGTLNSKAGDGYLMKFRDYPGNTPGDGWHPQVRFPGVRMGGVKVSGIVPTQPVLWVSTDTNIYCTNLPVENDNVLLEQNSMTFATTGYIDLPVIDLSMPTIEKYWYKVIIDAQQSPSTAIRLDASFDFGGFQLIGSFGGTTGILEYDVSIAQGAAYRCQPRLILSGTGASTPVVRGIALHHYLRPEFRRTWSFGIDVTEGNLPGRINANVVASLEAARRSVVPIGFIDLFNATHAVMFERLEQHTTGERNPEHGQSAVQFYMQAQLQEVPAVNLNLYYWDSPLAKWDDVATWS